MVLAIVSCVGGAVAAVGGVVSAWQSYLRHKARREKEEICRICGKPITSIIRRTL